MGWLSSFYAKHPEYRRLRVAKRSPTSIHFELEPGLYEAHFQIKPIYERSVSNLWLPAGQLAALGRLIGAAVANPRRAVQWAAMLPFATVLTLQPNAAAGKDTLIHSSNPTFNYGVTDACSMGLMAAGAIARSLLQFDLSSIPTGNTVQASVLSLVRQGNVGTRAYSFAAYRILRTWTEGTKSGGTPADGATWNTCDGTNNWGTAGCDNTTNDRNATGENSHTLNYAGNNSWSIPTMTQVWVSTPANNKGVLLATVDSYVTDGYWWSYSSDNGTAGNRPSLTVTYSPPAGGGIFNPAFSSVFRGAFG